VEEIYKRQSFFKFRSLKVDRRMGLSEQRKIPTSYVGSSFSLSDFRLVFVLLSLIFTRDINSYH
jgi:hypothetical protein